MACCASSVQCNSASRTLCADHSNDSDSGMRSCVHANTVLKCVADLRQYTGARSERETESETCQPDGVEQ